MSDRAPAWFEQKYIQGAMHVLQAEGYLTMGMTRKATSINGNEVTWKLAGTGEATQMSEAIEDRPTLNADRTIVKAMMAPWEANEWIKVLDVARMSENEQQVAQQTCGYALGRCFDNILFRTLDAAGAAIPTIGDGTAALNLTDLLAAQAAVMGPGVQEGFTLNVAVPMRWVAHLMLLRGFASADYVQDRPLLRRLGARDYLGMRIVPMPDPYFAVPAANQADGYMWMTEQVGFATPTDEKGIIAPATRVDYVATKKAWFAANTMMATAAVLQPAGIRRLRFATNAALTSGL